MSKVCKPPFSYPPNSAYVAKGKIITRVLRIIRNLGCYSEFPLFCKCWDVHVTVWRKWSKAKKAKLSQCLLTPRIHKGSAKSPPLQCNSPLQARTSSLQRLYIHTQTHQTRYDSSGRVIGPTQRPLPYNTQHSQRTDIHAAGGIRTRNPSKRAAAAPRLSARRVEVERHKFVSSTTDGGEWGVCLRQKPHSLSTRNKDVSREGKDRVIQINISCPSRKSNPGHPARIRSLYWLRNGNLTSGNLAMIMHLSTSPACAIVFGQRSEPAAYWSCIFFFVSCILEGPWKEKYFMMWQELNTAQRSSCWWFKKVSMSCVSWTDRNILKDNTFDVITYRNTINRFCTGWSARKALGAVISNETEFFHVTGGKMATNLPYLLTYRVTLAGKKVPGRTAHAK
jgi:hypothetical protein